jgi:dihydroxyacetone kinase-like protein
MSLSPQLLPALIQAIASTIENNAEEVTALDQAIGDGDHVFNLQRGLDALVEEKDDLAQLDWVSALQKIGMTLMSTVGGASGSLFGTLFIAMSKAARDQELNLQSFAEIFSQGVESVKQRGKADVGEKTMLDVLVPAALSLKDSATASAELPKVLENIKCEAVSGMESTRDMLATKGRASFLGERTKGHIDPGAKTTQLMICAVADTILTNLTQSP